MFGEWFVFYIVNEIFRGLVVDGVIGGVGLVFSFFLLVFFLFFVLFVLEDVGYMVRVVVLMEGIMRKFGFFGKVVIFFIFGFGCNVFVVMVIRIFEDERDRLVVMFVNLFIFCLVCFSVISFLVGIFFSFNYVLVVLSVYLIVIFVVLFLVWFVSYFVVRGEESFFVIEFLEYFILSWKIVIFYLWERSKEFVKKVGIVIFLGLIFIWYFSNYLVEFGSGKSYVEMFGYFFELYMMLMGFDWKVVVSLIFGIIVKENVIFIYGVIYGIMEVIKNVMILF